MSQTMKARIGFVVPRSGTAGPRRIQALLPPEVQIETAGLRIVPDDRAAGSLYDLKGAKQVYLDKAPQIAQERRWQGMAVSGAPVEVLNPGLLSDLQAKLTIPVTTALTSCAAAIKAFSAERVLLITPFDRSLDEMVADYLAGSGIEAVYPLSKPFPDFDAGSRLSSEEIFRFTRQAYQAGRQVQGIYFQGPLDNQPILEKLEQVLDVPVVTSRLGILWHLLSKLGLSYRVQGSGRLLYEWPDLPE